MHQAGILYLCGLFSLNLPLYTAAIECKCSTKECRIERLDSCTARYACYVEIHADDDGLQTGSVSRGCIDTKTSLLCENRRPNIRINRPWPYLYCCKSDFCNQEVLPTLPSNHKTTVLNLVNSPASTVYPLSHLQAVSQPESNRSVNPMYIAIPIIGICILLALIVFALYLLRQRTEYNSFQSPSSGVSNPNTTNDHFTVNGVHNARQPVIDSKTPTAASTMENSSNIATTNAAASAASAVAAVAAEAATSGPLLTKAVGNNKDLISHHCSESDRSSSGSETKLFLQV
ncbi:uncharacterized protein LOC115216248 [Argonauta hians]